MTDLFGLVLEDRPPDGWTPLEAVVTVKCLNDQGEVDLFDTATPGLRTYEAVGLLRWTTLRLDAALAEGS